MKIYKFKTDIDSEALAKLQKFKEIGCDTEASGLKIPHFDSLSLIQLSGKNDEAYIIQPDRKNYNCPNLVKLFEDSNILFIFHFFLKLSIFLREIIKIIAIYANILICS